MKIAILSCNTGGGHNAAAAALAEELSARGHESRTYNTLDFLPKGAADLISRGHDFAYRYAPKLYGAGYRMEEKRPSPLLYENSIRGIGPLYEALVDLGADAAICVHVFPAMMMTELRCGYGLRMPTWFVATDFTCSPGVGELQLDGICIPHPALTPEFQAAGLPAQRIFPTGIPIRRQFCQPPDRDAARRQLELEGCRHVFTLACGSMGAGPLRSTAACIAGLLGPEDRLGGGVRQQPADAPPDDRRLCGQSPGPGSGLHGTDVCLYAGVGPADLQGRGPYHRRSGGLPDAAAVSQRGARLRKPQHRLHDEPGLCPGGGERRGDDAAAVRCHQRGH